MKVLVNHNSKMERESQDNNTTEYVNVSFIITKKSIVTLNRVTSLLREFNEN